MTFNVKGRIDAVLYQQKVDNCVISLSRSSRNTTFFNFLISSYLQRNYSESLKKKKKKKMIS